MNHWFHPEARAEFLGSVRYYESQQPGLGRRFLEAVTDAIRRIEAHPNQFRVVSGTWRQCRVSRFPFGLIYRVRNDRIEIIAVMHLHRKPEYWQHRSTPQNP
jgi:plasmid stabilization system protein ParE